MAPGTTLREKFENLAKLGYQGIEITTSSRPECVEEIKQACEATGVQPTITSARGGALLEARKEERDQALQAHKVALEIAAEIGALGVISPPLITVKMQNRPRIPDLSPLYTRAQLERLLAVELYRELAEYGAQVGARVIIEPLNRYEQWWPCTLAQAVELCREVNHPNCRMMADFFHMNIEEADIAAAIRQAGEYILNVHLADSHRQTPPRGHTDFRPGFRALKDLGYEHYFALECQVPGDPREELARVAEYLRELYEAA